MPPLTPPQQTALVAAVAGAVVGAAALAWSVAHFKGRSHYSAIEAAHVAPENWTKAQVAAWLRENGVSKAAVALCLRFNLTGETLLQVAERDLYRMGVPLRDARIILAAVADLMESPVLRPRLSLPPSPRQSSVANASSRPPPPPPPPQATVPVTAASPGERFEAAWNALMRTCVLQSGDASPTEQQQRAVVYTSALLECFQALSPREQATALALVAAAEDSAATAPAAVAAAATHQSSAVDTPSSPATGAATAAPDAAAGVVREVEQKLQPLHAMLDGFLAFLQSPELNAVPTVDFEELSARVAGQVKRVVRVGEQLPPEMGGPLLRKCEKVFEALKRRHRAADAASTGEQENHAAVMQGLYDLISDVKDPATQELPPAQRAKVLAALLTRAEAMETLTSGAVTDVPRDAQAQKILQPVLQLLQVAVRTAAQEAAVDDESKAAAEAEANEAPTHDGDDEDGKADGGREAEERSMTNADIPVVVETTQKIQKTLQSAEFQHAPAEVRAQLCAVLCQRISALEDRTAGLPGPTQSAVRELLRNTKAALAVVGNAAAATTAAASTNAAQEFNESADEADDEAAADAESEAKEEAETEVPAAAVPPVNVERCVEQLEKIFEFVTSEALEHAPADERRKMAAELMQRVDKIRDEVAGSPAEGPVVSELIEPLYDLLKNMASTQAPSRQFLEVTAPLRDVQGLLNSSTFEQVPHAEQMRIARGIVPQLQRLTAAFATLPASERAAAEELARPISEALLRIMRERSTSDVTPQNVLDRLQAVMRTIQGAEFTTMTPAGRSAWAAKAVAELRRLDDDCASLGPEGDALRPIVQRLEKQLKGLFAADGDEQSTATGEAAAEAAAEAQAEGEEERVWATVRAMQAELTAAEDAGTPVPPARLQQMLSVLGDAAELGDITDEQESRLQVFGEALRQQVEGATAEPGDEAGKEEDEEAQDAEGAGDALESLRVSLQTLLDVAQEDSDMSGAELLSIVAKTEELITMADEAGVKWREDAQCSRAVRSMFNILQESGNRRDAAASPSHVERVLQSSIDALAAAPPRSKKDFVPFMRVLQLTQPAAEQMTNRELELLKKLQEAVIAAMRCLPEPSHAAGEAAGAGVGAEVPEHADEGDGEEEAKEGGEEENEEEAEEDQDGVDAVLDALLDMSSKLRDGSYTAEQLDEFEAIKYNLEDLLTKAGVDPKEAVASVEEQIQLQREALRHAQDKGEDESHVKEEKEGEGEASPLEAVGMGGEAAAEAAEARDGTDVFNEDDEDDAASDGAAAAAAAVTQTDPATRTDENEVNKGGEGEQEIAKP